MRRAHGYSATLLFALAILLVGCEKEEVEPVKPPPPDASRLQKLKLEAAFDTVPQDVRRAIEAARAESDIDPLLWRVEGRGGTMYLFGTIHLGVSGDLESLPLPVREAFRESKIFVTEADVRRIDPAELSAMILLPTGERLDQKLGDEAWNRLLEQLDGIAPPSMLRRMRPWVVETLLLEKMMKSGTQMDRALLDEAVKSEKNVRFLEDWKMQIRLMNRGASVEQLAELIESPQELEKTVRATIHAYRLKDVERLESLLFSPEKVDRNPLAYEEVFEKRNREWVPKLVHLMGGGDIFVAVGVGHLLGDDRLQKLMEERGFDVRRVEGMLDHPDDEADNEAGNRGATDAGGDGS